MIFVENELYQCHRQQQCRLKTLPVQLQNKYALMLTIVLMTHLLKKTF